MRPIFAKRTGVPAKPSQATRVLVHMAENRAKASAKADAIPSTASKTPSKSPSYPWGLSFSLDHGGLTKLGMKNIPKVGTAMTVHARVHVKSSSSGMSEDGTPHRNADFQITHMRFKDAGEEAHEPSDSPREERAERKQGPRIARRAKSAKGAKSVSTKGRGYL